MNAPIPDDTDDNTPDEIPTEETESTTASMSAFLPLTLLSLSFALILFWQIRSTSKQCDAMTQTLEQTKGAVLESQQLQSGITKLISDLYEVAKDDNDAKLILYTYGVCDPKTGKPLVTVSNQGGPSGSAVGSVSPSPSPTASGTK